MIVFDLAFILGLLIGCVALAFGFATYYIARKGFTGRRWWWFWVGFFTGPIGLGMVLIAAIIAAPSYYIGSR
ncbi:MAG: hypothetical protein OXU36_10650 [Candidatus Poribacteria bacterium]|nr:hypothetical protein [Candidatus Poribacteria bacterium]